jgi:hypothetical protein
MSGTSWHHRTHIWQCNHWHRLLTTLPRHHHELQICVLLHLLSNCKTLRNIIWSFSAMTSEAESCAFRNDCRLSRAAAPSSSQLVPQRPLWARPLMMLVVTASTVSCLGNYWNHSNYEWPEMCSQGDPASGFRCGGVKQPFSLSSTQAVTSISHPLRDGGGWRKAGLPSLRKIQLLCLCSVIYMGTVAIELPTQCFPFNTCSTIESIKE